MGVIAVLPRLGAAQADGGVTAEAHKPGFSCWRNGHAGRSVQSIDCLLCPDWDAVAALATPPDMAWVALAIADQGRPDLTGDLLTERREAFLQAGLNRLDSR